MPGARARLSAILLAGLMAATATAGAEAGSHATRHQDAWPHVTNGNSGFAKPRREFRHEYRRDFRHGVRRERGLPFDIVVNRLVYDGYADIRLVRQSDTAWLVTAVRNNGAVYRLKIDQRDGRIISRFRSGWSSVPLPGERRKY